MENNYTFVVFKNDKLVIELKLKMTEEQAKKVARSSQKTLGSEFSIDVQDPNKVEIFRAQALRLVS